MRQPVTSNGPSAFSLPRLVIASVSSAAAAVVVHQLWPPGTIPSAALTPVLVELFAAGLRRVNPRWLEAAALGLVAFACGAAGLTAGELIVQRSVASPDQRT